VKRGGENEGGEGTAKTSRALEISESDQRADFPVFELGENGLNRRTGKVGDWDKKLDRSVKRKLVSPSTYLRRGARDEA